MIRRIPMLFLLATFGCGDGGNEGDIAVAGERCKDDGSSACGVFGQDAMLCVNGKWEVQQTCDPDSELCVVSVGQAVCSVGGEPCDTEGDTQCVDDAIQQTGLYTKTWHVLQCDGRAWEIYSECNGGCSFDAGEATCD